MSNYSPGELICVDEYMSLWKGRLRFKIYIPNKRLYGVKVYMLCTMSGYLHKFIVYTVAVTRYVKPNFVKMVQTALVPYGKKKGYPRFLEVETTQENWRGAHHQVL